MNTDLQDRNLAASTGARLWDLRSQKPARYPRMLRDFRSDFHSREDRLPSARERNSGNDLGFLQGSQRVVGKLGDNYLCMCLVSAGPGPGVLWGQTASPYLFPSLL